MMVVLTVLGVEVLGGDNDAQGGGSGDRGGLSGGDGNGLGW